MTFTRNLLDPSDPFSPNAKVTPLLGHDWHVTQIDVPASTCFRSIGYISNPLPGFGDLNIPFDSERGIIPNDGQGRAITTSTSQGGKDDPSIESTTAQLPGVYCAGWVKRGPTGVIASTMTDAFATADAIAEDWAAHNRGSGVPSFLNSSEGGSTGLGWSGVSSEAEKRGLRPTSWRDWEQIDAAEKERGRVKDKVREKFGRVEEMMEVLS